MFMVTFSFARPADGLFLSQAAQSNEFAASSAGPVNSVAKEGAISTAVPQGSAKESSGNGISQLIPRRKLIVIGFLGGKVRAGNLVHREAQLIKTLQLGYPLAIRAEIFANSDGNAALRAILEFLDEDGDGRLSDEEKKSARIVLFGHSWGASQTITLAKRLNKLQIPVLLTIQVDSVRKLRQNDGDIPPNVLEAVNFYQSEGLLRGRKVIVAMDPAKTKILGNHESSYRQNPVSCAGFPWYARAFMRRHIEIENDPAVWNQIEELILFRAR
jgi:pimeloyl-ACP methyl ester carboxylesterase